MVNLRFLERVDDAVYRLTLSLQLTKVHNVFRVPILRKYHFDPSHVIKYEHLELTDGLSYVEKPIQIVDKKDKVLRFKIIPMVKVIWQYHSSEVATWELENLMRQKYSHFF